MEEIHTPRGHSYLISGFLICDDDDDDYYCHHHQQQQQQQQQHLIVVTANISKLHIMLLLLCKIKGQ
jgi:hypothetical protein